jgi:helicase
VNTKQAIGRLLEYGFIDGFAPTPLGRAVTRHFLTPTTAFAIRDAIRRGDDPFDLVATVELLGEDD